jgi:DNA (cytosine-5)-methyltransferase 1
VRYLSVCSGIEAASAAWHSLGWTPVAFAEVEPFPSAVLAQRFPGVPNWGDMTKFQEWPDADVDVLVGGTPCQSFSVAGLRKGLDDPRGSLMLVFLAIAARYRPRYVVWENVPGVLSSGGGRDFGSFLGALGQLGYGWAYRVLDAQWFGVAQRRRRVFVVGCAGDQRRAAQVLFEREGVCRHPAPRREAGQRPAPSLAARTRGGGGLGTDAELDGALIASTGSVSHCLNADGMNRQDYETETLIAHALRAEGHDASEDGTGRGTPLVPVAFAQNQRDEVREMSVAGALAAEPGAKQQTYVAFHPTQDPISSVDGTTHAMGAGSERGKATVAVATHMQVRRLTPRECERLQGFPDDWTLIPWRGKPAAECPDGPRYKALGNSMAVPCMRWIGERIAKVSA